MSDDTTAQRPDPRMLVKSAIERAWAEANEAAAKSSQKRFDASVVDTIMHNLSAAFWDAPKAEDVADFLAGSLAR